MTEILKTAAAFALAGVMLAIMLAACGTALLLPFYVYDKIHKVLKAWRADYRYRRAKKCQNEREAKVIRHGAGEKRHG